MKQISMWIISCVYQKFLRLFLPSACIFYPSCSDYTKEAIEKYGTIKGMLIGSKRISRCFTCKKNAKQRYDPLT